MADDVLAVWMDGYAKPAGLLVRVEGGETAFFYEDDYVAAGGLPLSLSMPLDRREFGDVDTRAFFANLLPENSQLERLMQREGLGRDDVVGLLRHLGADCAGAVSCIPVGATAVKTPGVLAEDYEPLDNRTVARIVRSLYEERRLPDDVADPSPVAGVQRKIAITVLEDGGFALPRVGSRVPTTHILKVPGRNDGRDAAREEAAALLAAAAGLEVSIPSAIKIDGIDALLVTRFDRRVEDGAVTRIHQEDFAQALGFASELKYQRNGRPGRRFDVTAAVSVLDRTDDPLRSRLEFLKATIFNLCIGNTDNHAKNHALLYGPGGVPSLAPLYDLLPIRLNKNYTHDLAFAIGEAATFDAMTGADLNVFFGAMGVARVNVPELVQTVIIPIIEALEAASPRLRSTGLKTFDDLMGREMEELAEKLAIAVAVEPRDYFPADGT